MWSPEIYLKHPNEAAARASAAALGMEFPDTGEIPTGNENFALHAPMQPPWITPPVYDEEDGSLLVHGVPEPGFFSMLRLNMDWSGYEATMTAIDAAGVRVELPDPPVVWA